MAYVLKDRKVPQYAMKMGLNATVVPQTLTFDLSNLSDASITHAER